MTTFRSQGIDYLGFLDAKLRDLQGYATLAHELIQNADDAQATSMSFDVRDEALVVESTSAFSDCGQVEADECPWETSPDRNHRRSLSYQPVPPSPEEVAVKHRIDALSTAHPCYGSRKMTVILNEEGVLINRKRVQRYLREMGIAGITPGPNLSKRAAHHRIYPYLLRGVTAAIPNVVWGSDITDIRLKSGWLYLVAILDWHSRYVISWALDNTLELPFVLDAVDHTL